MGSLNLSGNNIHNSPLTNNILVKDAKAFELLPKQPNRFIVIEDTNELYYENRYGKRILISSSNNESITEVISQLENIRNDLDKKNNIFYGEGVPSQKLSRFENVKVGDFYIDKKTVSSIYFCLSTDKEANFVYWMKIYSPSEQVNTEMNIVTF